MYDTYVKVVTLFKELDQEINTVKMKKIWKTQFFHNNIGDATNLIT